MYVLICPVCKKTLERREKTYVCENGHSFDRAKSGYVNLLCSQKSSDKRHGDDKAMLSARRDFLEKGFYSVLCDEITADVEKFCAKGTTILDAGCGEGWYTQRISERMKGSEITAIDISKDALLYTAKRGVCADLAVASVFDIPVASSSCGAVISIFAPTAEDEFSRVLSPRGVLIKAVPLERHLWSLKAVIYDKPYENATDSDELDGFELVSRREIKSSLTLDNAEDIHNLFLMTPYYYKTSEHDQKKLAALNTLTTELEFAVLVYKKK